MHKYLPSMNATGWGCVTKIATEMLSVWGVAGLVHPSTVAATKTIMTCFTAEKIVIENLSSAQS